MNFKTVKTFTKIEERRDNKRNG